MEKLTENNPRFCAKYVKNIGIAKEKKLGFYHVFELNGKLYVRAHNLDVNVGDKVWIAKKIKTPNKEWSVHEIIVPEDYWYYKFHANKTAKEQRQTTYVAKAKTWFGNQRYIIQEVKKVAKNTRDSESVLLIDKI